MLQLDRITLNWNWEDIFDIDSWNSFLFETDSLALYETSLRTHKILHI